MTDRQSSNFTRLKANILFNNTLREEPISIRNVWKKGANYYFDVLFYASKQTRVLDISYFHDIYDTKTRRYYKDMQLFIKDFEAAKAEQDTRQALSTPDEPLQQNRPWNEDKAASHYQYLNEIRNEAIILKFFAKLNPNLADVKQRVIIDYIKSAKPNTANFSRQYIEAFVATLPYDKDDFYDSLDKLEHTNEEHIEYLVHEAAKISAADGAIHYEEKRFLAELLQSLREHGLEPDIEF